MIKKNKLALLLIIFMALNLAITSLPSQTWAEEQVVIDSENLADYSADPDQDFGNSEDGLGIAGDELPETPGQEGVEAVEQPQGESVEEPQENESANTGEHKMPTEENLPVEEEDSSPVEEALNELKNESKQDAGLENADDLHLEIADEEIPEALTQTNEESIDPNNLCIIGKTSDGKYYGVKTYGKKSYDIDPNKSFFKLTKDEYETAAANTFLIFKRADDKDFKYPNAIIADSGEPVGEIFTELQFKNHLAFYYTILNSGPPFITGLEDVMWSVELKKDWVIGGDLSFADGSLPSKFIVVKFNSEINGNGHRVYRADNNYPELFTLGDKDRKVSVKLKNIVLDGSLNGDGNIPQYNGINVVESSDLALGGGVIIKNCYEKDNGGGAIKLSNGSNLTMSGENTIQNCVAELYGGAILVRDNSTVNIDGTAFLNNSGQQGGAIFCSKKTSSIQINNATFAENCATGYGGAIHINVSTLAIEKTKFETNNAKLGGGAIYFVGDASLTIEDGCSFKKNSANNEKSENSYGGALYIGSESTASITNSIFEQNTAGSMGGAIFTSSNQYESPIKDENAYKNLTTDKQTTFTGNTAGEGLFPPPSNFDKFTNLEFSVDSDVTHRILKEKSLLNNYDINYKIPGTIFFDANGGVFEDGSNIKYNVYPMDSNITIIPAPTREGYTFDYWKGSEYQPGDTYKVTEERHIFVAQWKRVADNATITFDANGGVFADGTNVKSEEYEKGEEITIINAPTREGYTFDYWKGSEYQPGDKYTVVEDHTFVAQWKEEPTPSEVPEIVLPGPILPRPLTVSPPAVVKQIKGGQPAMPDNFTFRLEAVGYKALAGQQDNLPEPWSLPLPQDTDYNRRTPEGTATLIQLQGAGSGLFGQMTYTKPGDYTYKITEVSDQNMPYIFDKTVYTFTDHVYEQGDKLVSDRTLLRNGQPINSITAYFTNEYTGTNSLQEQVQQLPATGYKESLGLGLCLLSAGLLFFIKKKA